MHHLRRSRLPALLVGLAIGIALFPLEFGHSLGHRHAASQAESHGIVVADHDDAASAPADSAPTHPHLDQQPTPPGTVSLRLLVERTVPEFRFDLADALRPDLFARDLAPSPGRNHGPPPPSRAPPRS